jgi:hypothetical protein
MDPIAVLTVALAQGIVQVGTRLAEEGIVKPALKPAAGLLEK